MATQTQGKETRERILAAGEQLVLAQGFTATSVGDILKATGLTKGAFFHHFRSKAEFGRALVERGWERDLKLLQQLAARADELAEDPLHAALLFMRLIEESFGKLAEPVPGCMLASYVYENEQFEDDVNSYVEDAFRRWIRLYEDKFAAVLTAYKPRVPVTAKDLAEQMACILEGAFVIARAYSEPDVILSQSRLARQHLQLLFADAPANRVTESGSHA